MGYDRESGRRERGGGGSNKGERERGEREANMSMTYKM